MKTAAKAQHEIRGIVTSLYYLAKEADLAEFSDISMIIRQAIQTIETTMAKSGNDVCAIVANEETYVMLEFLNTFIQSPTDVRKNFLEVISCVCSGERKTKAN